MSTTSHSFAYRSSYGLRAEKQKNPAAKKLLEIMEEKKSNLAVSVDVTKSKDFLAIIDAVGPFVCMIKVVKIPSPSIVYHCCMNLFGL
jgi:hypothetical protein